MTIYQPLCSQARQDRKGRGDTMTDNEKAIELLDEWFDEEPIEETPEPEPLKFGD